ncbi:MAG: hypothetical protein IT379_35910 [Deltaproteobacteria bacterium]|nr:hypothetical protein [Deltaproteobacteria bacterium]
MSVDVMEEPNPFAQASARARNRALLIAAVVVSLIGGGIAARMAWPSAGKDLEAARPAIEGWRAQYCRVWEHAASAPLDANDLRRPGRPLVLPGFIVLDNADISEPRPGTDTDGIDGADLARLCDRSRRAPGPEARVFNSLFGKIDVLDDAERVERYERDGVALALREMRRIEYLVVLRVQSMRPSVATTPGIFTAGELQASAHLYRLRDAQPFGSVAIRAQAPAQMSVITFAGPGMPSHDRQMQVGLAVETAAAYRRAVTRAFDARGVVLRGDS